LNHAEREKILHNPARGNIFKKNTGLRLVSTISETSQTICTIKTKLKLSLWIINSRKSKIGSKKKKKLTLYTNCPKAVKLKYNETIKIFFKKSILIAKGKRMEKEISGKINFQ
jgi:hypothetical protein